MKLKVDTYYDLTCGNCGRSWSTDFDEASKTMNGCGMGMETNIKRLFQRAYASGWKFHNGSNCCPDCMKT